MKQFHFGFCARIRSRKARVTSTLDTLRAASASDRAFSVRSCITPPDLVDYLRDQVQAVLDARRNRLEQLVLVGFRDAILTQPQGDVARVGHRLDTAHVDRAHLFDHPEDALEL